MAPQAVVPGDPPPALPFDPGQLDPGQLAEARIQATIGLMIVNGFATSLLGEQAAMTPYERGRVEEPLARIIARNLAVSAALDKYADLIAVVSGLGFWGVRVAGQLAQRRAASRPQRTVTDPDAPLVGPWPGAGDSIQPDHPAPPLAPAPGDLPEGTVEPQRNARIDDLLRMTTLG